MINQETTGAHTRKSQILELYSRRQRGETKEERSSEMWTRSRFRIAAGFEARAGLSESIILSGENLTPSESLHIQSDSPN